MPPQNNIEKSFENFYSSTASMLYNQANIIATSVFKLTHTEQAKRWKKLQEIYESIENFEIQPRQEQQADLIIIQGEAAIDQQKIKHAEIALQQAVYVKYVHDLSFPLQSTSAAETVGTQSLQEMITSLMAANRHLAMLEALVNLEGRHYSSRGSKGGIATSQHPNKEDRQKLLTAITKGILYNNTKLAKSDTITIIDEIAARIFKANREFEILDISNIGDLKLDVHNILLEKFSTDNKRSRRTDRLQLGYSLRLSLHKQDTEEAQQMSTKAARTLGRIEGVREVLTQLLEQRFGELPRPAIETLEAADDLDLLQTYLDRISKAQSLEDVIQGNS